METFFLAQLTIPLFDLTLLLAFSTLALLLGRVKLALLINYLFALYWGYIFNREMFVGSGPEKFHQFSVLYFGFGLVIVVLALIGFLTRHD